MNKTKVGIIGCGNISGIYIHNLYNVFENVELAACADIDISRAIAKTKEKDEKGNLRVPGLKAMSVDDLLKDEDIKIVANLTTPQAHFDVAMKALNANKNVYNEKPLALELEQGRELVKTAKNKGLMLGCAPDTFMGAGIQTCRKLIDDGWIGTPTSATAFMCCSGHESWHPDPAFYYQKGGGPMLDMGPYYLTALVNLLGPVKTVAGMTSKASQTRVCTCKNRYGEILSVEIPTHITGLLNFASGEIAVIITSFDIAAHHLPNIEVHGTLGSIKVPDPNTFGGEVEFCPKGGGQWQKVPLTHRYYDNSRGLAIADMANALTERRTNRANGELALHILEIMTALNTSGQTKTFQEILSTATKPQALNQEGIISN